ncbi:MAG: lipoyl(octanoyl) transferase LipB [Planctomycetota bacterium]|nr:lipoyl(octanoyl) transferase LipB [Planctomycetota bacterium]
MGELVWIDLGRAPYDEAMAVQREQVEQTLRNRKRAECVILVEHDPPVITLGRAANEGNVVMTPEQLEAMGFQVRRVGRGGDVTYHGPGQIVAYPILRLDERGRDVHAYLRNLEEVILRVLGRLGVAGERIEGLTGVWAAAGKVAAIGVAVQRWVTYHGFSLNVCPDLSHYRAIVPCGLDKPVTSVSELLGRKVETSQVKPLVIEFMVEVFGFERAVEGER